MKDVSCAGSFVQKTLSVLCAAGLLVSTTFAQAVPANSPPSAPAGPQQAPPQTIAQQAQAAAQPQPVTYQGPFHIEMPHSHNPLGAVYAQHCAATQSAKLADASTTSFATASSRSPCRTRSLWPSKIISRSPPSATTSPSRRPIFSAPRREATPTASTLPSSRPRERLWRLGGRRWLRASGGAAQAPAASSPRRSAPARPFPHSTPYSSSAAL